MNLKDLLAQGQRELNELRERERLEAEQRQQAELAKIDADRKAWRDTVESVLPEEARPYIVVGERPSYYDETMILLDIGNDMFPVNALIDWELVSDDKYDWQFVDFIVPWKAQTGSYIFNHGDVFLTRSFPLALAVAKERWNEWKADEAQEVMDARIP